MPYKYHLLVLRNGYNHHGLILRNRIIQACGLIAGIGGFFGALHYPDHMQLYVMAVVATVGLIVPGVIIHLHNKR